MRIAIVNDVLLAVEALRRAVVSRPEHSVIWIARDGAEAVHRCARDRPDVVLMDMIMPVMNGVEASRLIMAESPCAILVVTATVEGNISLVFEAMGHGALDAVNTPVLGSRGELSGTEELLKKIDLIGRLVGRPPPITPSPQPPPIPRPEAGGLPSLVVIGASTGGPAAVAGVLSDFKGRDRAAIVVVQHVDRAFASELAAWLSARSGILVRVTGPGNRPEMGKVWLAGTNDHLVMTPRTTFEHSAEPLECFYRPSVDVFFKSVSRFWPTGGIAVLLTGMGRDGAEGLLVLRKAGWHTIAQDARSSVVYGMPRAAAELRAAVEILPLPEIGGAVSAALARSST
jgi:two-component system response regulator WspF